LSRHRSETTSDNSIIMYNHSFAKNKFIGGREVQLATQTDKELCQQIDYYNEYLPASSSYLWYVQNYWELQSMY
jgi:hypothetical protein